VVCKSNLSLRVYAKSNLRLNVDPIALEIARKEKVTQSIAPIGHAMRKNSRRPSMPTSAPRQMKTRREFLKHVATGVIAVPLGRPRARSRTRPPQTHGHTKVD
jgi:hypothetical protein